MKNSKCYLMGMRFEDADVIDILGKIVDRHVLHYKSDFDYDKKILREAAGKEHAGERTFLWLCRINGTWLFKEKDVLLRDTGEHNAYCHYAGFTPGDVLSFAVELKGTDSGGAVRGDITPLDYGIHRHYVMERSVPVACLLVRYENGSRRRPAAGQVPAGPDGAYGRFLGFDYQPESGWCHHALLHEQRKMRRNTEPGDAAAFVARV